jgi:hypothetical protein
MGLQLEYILPPRAGKYQQLSLGGGGYEKGEEKGGNKGKRVKKCKIRKNKGKKAVTNDMSREGGKSVLEEGKNFIG